MEKKIGVFDSGVGGLTVLKSLVEILPNESYVYFGDTGNIPYGPKTTDEIAELSVEAYKKLKEFDVKMMVIACNTATIHGLEAIRKVADIPVIGVIDPGVDTVIESGCRDVLIIGTDATVNSKAIENKLLDKDSTLNIEGIGCPDMVLAVEDGNSNNEKGRAAVEKYLSMASKTPGCVLMACTHFPALEKHILDYYNERGEKVLAVNPAKKTAETAKEILESTDQLSESKEKGTVEFYSSADQEKFTSSGNIILGESVTIEETKEI